MSYGSQIKQHGALRFAARFVVRQFYKRILRRDYPYRLPTGLVLHCPPGNSFGSEVILSGADVDWGAEQILARFLEPHGAFIDVGAHIGYYSLYMRPLVREVHAFEPDRRNFVWLQRNCAGVAGVVTLPVAVSDRQGSVRFQQDRHSELSRIVAAAPPEETHVEVPCVSVDDYVAKSGLSVTGIKIDVEGADQLVLDGAVETVARCQPLILTECVPDQRLGAWCAQQGYRIFAPVGDRYDGSVGFQQVSGGSNCWTKMLFLVPVRLRKHFFEIEAGWKRRAG